MSEPKHAGDLAPLFDKITATRPQGAWPTIAKCHALAALVVAERPQAILEVGVFTGDSLIPMLLAQKYIGTAGRAYAVDPWSIDASVQGQDGANQEWWSKLDHEAVFQTFQNRLTDLDLSCTVLRQKSDDVDVGALGPLHLIHIDGNHGEQALRDVERFAPSVPLGGWLIFDDLNWTGGHVVRARDRAKEMGFVERYPLDNGVALQRLSV